MARYKFVDHWYVQAPIDRVFAHIADPATYPLWWPVYPEVEILPGVQPPSVGSRAMLNVASVLGYRLRLLTEIVEFDPPRHLGTVASGDLEGTGTWDLEQQGDTTAIRFIWIVRTHHQLLNVLEPVAKPLFAWSHNNASAKGHRGLKNLLEGNADRSVPPQQESRREGR
jgi:hypothetical protein